MESNHEIEVSAALIRGESPAKIARRLAKQGVPPDEVEDLLGKDAALLSRGNTRRQARWTARVVGAVIFVPSLLWNLYYLFFWPSGWLVSGLFWAITFFGLMVMLLGDFCAGCPSAIGRRQHDKPSARRKPRR